MLRRVMSIRGEKTRKIRASATGIGGITIAVALAGAACAPIAGSRPKSWFNQPALTPPGHHSRESAPGTGGGLPTAPTLDPVRFEPKMDPGMEASERTGVAETIGWIASRSAVAESEAFQAAFGGRGFAPSVFSYLKDRVGYLLSSSTTNLDERLRYESLGDTSSGAYNVGTALWFVQMTDPSRRLLFRFGDEDLQIRSSRIGLVRLGKRFRGLPFVARAASLVHEARHSDCTGGLLAEDLERLRQGEPREEVACGHQHVVCPEGHPLAGTVACDRHPWGAFTLQAVFARTVSRGCAGCSERDRQLALAVELERWTRVLFDKNELLAGRLGQPDMSSSADLR